MHNAIAKEAIKDKVEYIINDHNVRSKNFMNSIFVTHVGNV